VTSSLDGSTLLWNPQTAGVLFKWNNDDACYHSSPVTCLALHKENQLALTGAENGSLRLIHLTQGKIVSALQSHSESIEGLVFSEK
jgi:WD40 repeat protein